MSEDFDRQNAEITATLNKLTKGEGLTIVTERGFGIRFPFPVDEQGPAVRGLAKALTEDIEGPLMVLFAYMLKLAKPTEFVDALALGMRWTKVLDSWKKMLKEAREPNPDGGA